MSKQIYSKTKDYIQALLETEEIQAYLKAVDDFKSDTESKKLLADLQESQQTLAVFRQGGFTGVAEQERKVKFLHDKVSKDKKIQSLIKSQQDIQNLVGDLASEISQAINFPFAQPQRGGCCG